MLAGAGEVDDVVGHKGIGSARDDGFVVALDG